MFNKKKEKLEVTLYGKKHQITKEDTYELTRMVAIPDVKMYLQKEYDKAFEREDYIKNQENKIKQLLEVEMKYSALLVVQQNIQKRIDNYENTIKGLRKDNEILQDSVKLQISKNQDIKINAENKLKEKDNEIRDLKNELKKLTPKKKKVKE